MNTPSEADAYSYAKFLVDTFPEVAIRILYKKGQHNILALVEEQVDRCCIELGGSKNEIKGMVERRLWDELKVLKGSPSQSATTPRDYRRAGQGPPTPSSTASGSPQSQRNPSYDWIFVYGMEEKLRLTARPSGGQTGAIPRPDFKLGTIAEESRPWRPVD
jgi:hypothetical protein